VLQDKLGTYHRGAGHTERQRNHDRHGLLLYLRILGMEIKGMPALALVAVPFAESHPS
jgi:hypothetical protein